MGRPSIIERAAATVINVNSSPSTTEELVNEIGHTLTHREQHELLARCLALGVRTTLAMDTIRKFTRGHLDIASESRFTCDLVADVHQILIELEDCAPTADITAMRLKIESAKGSSCSSSAKIRLSRQALFRLRAWTDVSVALLADNLDLPLILDCQVELDSHLRSGLEKMQIRTTAPQPWTDKLHDCIEEYEASRLEVSLDPQVPLKDYLILLIGFISTALDISTDIHVGFDHIWHRKFLPGALTLLFVFLAGFFIAIQKYRGTSKSFGSSKAKSVWRYLLFGPLIPLRLVWRSVVDGMNCSDRKGQDRLDRIVWFHERAMSDEENTRYLLAESCIEDNPQLLLQAYLLLKAVDYSDLNGSFDNEQTQYHVPLSMFLSLHALAWDWSAYWLDTLVLRGGMDARLAVALTLYVFFTCFVASAGIAFVLLMWTAPWWFVIVVVLAWLAASLVFYEIASRGSDETAAEHILSLRESTGRFLDVWLEAGRYLFKPFPDRAVSPHVKAAVFFIFIGICLGYYYRYAKYLYLELIYTSVTLFVVGYSVQLVAFIFDIYKDDLGVKSKCSTAELENAKGTEANVLLLDSDEIRGAVSTTVINIQETASTNAEP